MSDYEQLVLSEINYASIAKDHESMVFGSKISRGGETGRRASLRG